MVVVGCHTEPGNFRTVSQSIGKHFLEAHHSLGGNRFLTSDNTLSEGVNPGEDFRQRRRSSELSHSVTTDPVAGESSTIFEAPTRAAISKAASSFSKGAVGDGRSDGRTGGFEVLVADIIVG